MSFIRKTQTVVRFVDCQEVGNLASLLCTEQYSKYSYISWRSTVLSLLSPVLHTVDVQQLQIKALERTKLCRGDI